jgi:hypothetical protein
LIDGFHSSAGKLSDVIDRGHEITPELQEVRHKLYKAVTALQFSGHGNPVDCAHQSAFAWLCRSDRTRCLGADDPDGATVVDSVPLKPNPVTQDEMDAGSVELF